MSDFEIISSQPDIEVCSSGLFPIGSDVSGQRRFRIALNDDASVDLPYPTSAGQLVHVHMWTNTTVLPYWFGEMLVDAGANILTIELNNVIGIAVVSFGLIGVSDPDGTLNIGFNGTAMRLRNRLGATISGLVELDV